MSYDNADDCTEVSIQCPVEASLYGDYFTTGACAFFVAAYAVLFLAQACFGYMSKTWSFTAYLAFGSILELAGYVGRIMMTSNPFASGPLIVQMVCLILAPTIIAAAISLTFKHLVLYYGARFSTIKPKLYPWVFVGSDFVSIIVQGIGGAIAAGAGTGPSADTTAINIGNNLLIAGVSFQVVNMVVCGGLMLIYTRRYRRANGATSTSAQKGPSPQGTAVQGDKVSREGGDKTVKFIYAIIFAYCGIIVRCIYRIPEMAMGWGSTLMQNEAAFMCLDGAMILISVIALTVFHPHFFFPFLGKKPADFSEKDDEGVSEHEMHAPLREES